MLIKAGSGTPLLRRAPGAAVKVIIATTVQFATLEQTIPANAKAFRFPSK